MKAKIILRAIGFFAIFGLIQACYYDNPPPVEPISPEDVSFSTHILPIFDNGCNSSGCHDGSRAPNLLADEAWPALRDGYINTTVPEESILYKSVEYLSGADPMPPGGPKIPELDRQLILAWIQKGAPND